MKFKKSLVSIFLCLLLVCLSITPCFASDWHYYLTHRTESYDDYIVLGDVDLNYSLSISDVTILQLYLAEYTDSLSSFELTACKEFGDYNYDGCIDVLDVTDIQRAICKFDNALHSTINAEVYKYNGEEYKIIGYDRHISNNICATLHRLGYSNKHIAAIIVNFGRESGIDPTAIEGIFDEPYNIEGEKHQLAIKSGFDMSVYAPELVATNFSYPKPAGIGICGFTGETATALLNYAKAHDSYHTKSAYKWYDWQLQLAFMLDPDSGFYASDWLWNEFKNTEYDDVESAVRDFVINVKRPINVDEEVECMLLSAELDYRQYEKGHYINSNSWSCYDVMAILNQ